MTKFPDFIPSKLPSVGTSIFAIMSQLANEHKAINLSQGFPDFDCSEKLKSLVSHYIKKGYNQYAPMPGIMPLRETIAEKTQFCYSAVYNPDTEITITSGATEALYSAISAFVREGDEVVVFEPAYDSYVPAILINGGTPIYGSLSGSDFKINWDETQKMINQRTRMIIINSPHNPTGSTLSAEDMKRLEKITKNTNIIILSDEVYEHIVYPPFKHTYFASLPGMFERTISCSSLSKTYSITGWRLGYIIASARVIDAARKVHDFLTVGAAAPLQEAAVTALLFPDSYYDNLQAYYRQKKNLFLGLLDAASLKYTTPQGAYYVMVDISEFGVDSDVDFCEWMAREIGVAAVPGSSFFREDVRHLIRFHFAKKEDTLREAGRRLLKLRELAQARA